MRADRRDAVGARLQFGIHRLAEIVAQQHVFGGDGAVGLKLEHPVSIGTLALQQRVGRGLDGAVDRGGLRSFSGDIQGSGVSGC